MARSLFHLRIVARLRQAVNERRLDIVAYGVVYKITNTINGKSYVGQTKQKLSRRIAQHKVANSAIGNAIRKYGIENFIIEVIEECATLEQLNKREKFWIAFFNCKAPNGYNRNDGGEGSPGRFCSDETRVKKSLSVTGKKNPFFGRHHTTSSKNKMSTSHIGNKSWLGLHHTAEENFKISISKRGTTPYKNLRKEMDKRNFSYNSLAKLFSFCHQTVSDKMSGKRNFTEKQIANLVEFFGKPAEYLMARSAD